MFAIKTTYKGPTDTRGSRIVASCLGHKVSHGYLPELTTWQNHSIAMLELVRQLRADSRLPLGGQWVGGELDSASYVWCHISQTPDIG